MLGAAFYFVSGADLPYLPDAAASGVFLITARVVSTFAYYNEHDPYAAAWLENLIHAGAIAPGVVDTRSILDVRPADLDGFTQCHFFAGIGIWSRALRSAGWPNDRPVWTGSCPCQPFSAAGAGHGFDDDRHLFPGWQWLIEQCRPETVFGEQVASADGLVWADLVQAAMEASDYAVGFVDTCAAGFRSFHIRQRLYFAAEDLRLADGRVGNPNGARGPLGVSEASGRHEGHAEIPNDRGRGLPRPDAGRSSIVRLDHAAGARCDGAGQGAKGKARDETRLRGSERGCGPSGLAYATDGGRIGGAGLPDQSAKCGRGELANQGRVERVADAHGGDACAERQQPGGQQRLHAQGGGFGFDVWADPSDGYWRDADWLYCRDGKWRPVEPGTFPLAYACPARLGRLRAYGNGLDLAQATGFIRAYNERDMGDPRAADLFEWSVT